MSLSVAFALVLSALSIVANSQLTLSPTSFTVVEGASFQVTCTHGLNAEVTLKGLVSVSNAALNGNVTVFTVSNVSRLDNNKAFACTQASLNDSSPATITVFYLTAQIASDLVVVSTAGDFYLNISVVANPFIIPANITVQTPPGVTLPAFTVTGVNDTGTANVKLDLFQLPRYAGNYAITFRHPAVSAYVVRFNLTVLYAPRYTYNSTLSNTIVDISAVRGTAQSLSCAVTGVPQPTVVGLNATFIVATNSYTFTAVSFSDAGLYVCVANNTMGSNTITYRLTVKASPNSSSDANARSSVLMCILIGAILVILF